MDTVTVIAPPVPQSSGAVLSSEPEAQRTLSVSVTYLLSEAGRKASLLSGGDGRAIQQLTIDIPANRLHLVSVDTKGVARLTLRPQYRREQERIVRLDAAPTYDAPPTLDDLFREAAQNHQLERAYQAERQVVALTRRDAERTHRLQRAQAFLADQTQRAILHPAPTPKRCVLSTDHGRVLFDVTKDEGPAKDVPPEAHRRFRADLRARRDQNMQTRTAQLALHEEKRRTAAEWIARHGTADQQARQEAGVLPLGDAIEAIADQAFAAVSDRPRYTRDGVARLQSLVRQQPQGRDVVLAPGDLVVTSADAPHMTAEQWVIVNDVRRLLPGAAVTLRVHKVAWKARTHVSLSIFSVVATQRVGPLTLRREYLATPADNER